MLRVSVILAAVFAASLAACAEQDSIPTAADTAPARSVSASAISTDALVAYFPFDGDAADASGNGHDGVPSVSGVAYVEGVNGQAASFATGAFVRVPDDPQIDTDAAMTVSALVRPSSFSASGSIFLSKWYSSPIIGDWILRLVPNGDGTGRLLANAADYDTNYAVTDPGEIYALYQSPDSPQFPLGTWTFVAMTFDGGTLTIYVNGAIVGQVVTAFSVIEPSEYAFVPFADDLFIGDFRGANIPVYRFSGAIDEVRLYDRALSSDEVLGLLKNHCKDGGWEAFGFPNQGQCVRWVEAGKDVR